VAKEIERKFRLARAPAWLAARGGEEVEQGYLSIDANSEVRLRRRGDDRILTVKRGRGESRDELEVLLDHELFERLWAVTEGRRLSKRRTVVDLDEGLRAEVDVYAGRLAGLVVAEVEFGSLREAEAFQRPSWFGAEVTGDELYANRSLARAEAPPEIGGGEGGNQEVVSAADEGIGRSRAYRLKRKEAPAAGLRRIAAGRLSKATERLRAAERGEDVAESIHAARKDLKKLRAVLRLVRAELGERRYGAEDGRYRDVGRALSGARDARVKVETLDALLEQAEVDAAILRIADSWRRELSREDEEASARAQGGEAVASALKLLAAADGPVEGWSLGDGSWSLVGPGLTRAYERGRRAMRDAGGGDAEAVHRWRKRVKDLWYHQRLLRGVWPEAMELAAAQSHELAELLGDHHDLAVLAEDLRRREFARADTAVLERAISRRQEELLERARDRGRRIYVEKPKAFHRRIRGYWKLWANA